jgi:DNA-binding NarL/FixJ family response regulator
MSQLTLVIADDHPLFRAALKEAVGRHLRNARIIEASSLMTLQRAIAENAEVDLVLLDLRMPGAKGFSALLYLRAEHPAIPVIVVSASETASVAQRALDFGASGFIPKSSRIDAIGDVLRTVLDGGVSAPILAEDTPAAELDDRGAARRLSTLTPQQLRVLILLADGQSNKYVAANLAITEATVKAHITGILRKLGVERRTQAAILAQRLLETGERMELSLDDEG